MSLATPLSLPGHDRRDLSSPRLRPVERSAGRRRPRLAYAMLALAGAGLIGAAQIGLSIATTQDSFTVAELTQQNRELGWQADAEADQLAGLNSPQQLAEKAAGLGLVVGGSVNYLRLSDGSVTGAAGPAAQTSTVNPLGPAAVPNALLVRDTPQPPAAPEAVQGAPSEAGTPPAASLPPTVEGLPTPSFG